MFNKILGKLINNNDYKLSELQPIVEKINALEPKFEKLKDSDIKKQTQKWQKEKGLDIDKILPEAFALVREAAKRSMNQRPRDVQLMAAIVLHQGKIAEQKTGEGKTLTATLPLYLNALTGQGAHLVTPNDYLSKHGAGWYGPVYHMLGMSVGVIIDDVSYVYDPEYTDAETLDEFSRHLKPSNRVDAYKCDITYGTNSQFGFDYLRDNMGVSEQELVQINPNGKFAVHNFAIVDEVDSILIDIARTPLIISSQKDLQPEMYHQFAELAVGLVKETDYELNEKDRVVTLTELGINKIERKLGVKNLYEKDFLTVHHIENALKAKALFIKDKDYVVKDGQVIIVDQNTGRMLMGNRWSDGLHQAVEAKESLQIQAESKTVATISYQNYFRLYNKLAGMTGTAATESEEFFKIYKLDVVIIPTNKPLARKDKSDLVYKTETAKYRAIAKDIAERNKKGQPVLIGTTSVDKSQLLSTYLKRLKIKHEVLNAKNHEREALIIADAGKKSAVTVSTNMAGRGVDIILGGQVNSPEYKEVIKSGGLYVIGTERHDSRRIDNQLRGRSGRQGDVGESRFFLSLQDDLLRIFGGEKIESVMNRMGVDENMPIEAGLISRSIENAQKKVEGMNFDSRKALVEYDDVMNVQREAIYGMRRKILFSKKEDSKIFFDWIIENAKSQANADFNKVWDQKLKKHGNDVWFEVVKRVSLEVIGVLWMEHIDTMDDLRSGVRLRGYGQVDPLVEYKREGRELFERLTTEMWHTIADRLVRVEVQVERNSNSLEATNPLSKPNADINFESGKFESGVMQEAEGLSQTQKPITNKNSIGRNDPCWCGSGKKFKKCHGRTS